MPEIIEVKKYARYLRKRFRKNPVKNVRILRGRYKGRPFSGYNILKRQLPFRVKKVETIGKRTVFYCSGKDKDFMIAISLGMSGGWLEQKGDKVTYILSKESTKHSTKKSYGYVPERTERSRKNAWKYRSIAFELAHSTLYFYDVRHFGTFRVFIDEKELQKKSPIGSEITSISFKDFKTAVQEYPNVPIGTLLLNQKVVSGIGNYLRSEILWCARVNPFHKVKSLSSSELRRIYKYAKEIINTELGKSTSFKKGRLYKLKKRFDEPFFVYRRRVDILGNPVKRSNLGGRTIHWVDFSSSKKGSKR